MYNLQKKIEILLTKIVKVIKYYKTQLKVKVKRKEIKITIKKMSSLSADIRHWLFRVGPNASNLYACSPHNVWGINSANSGAKYFIRNAKIGDIIWFVKGGSSKGLLVAFATYTGFVNRVKGENLSDAELGWNYQCPWVKNQGWDIEIQYNQFRYIEDMNLLSKIVQSANPRRYNEKCKVNLPEIYEGFERLNILCDVCEEALNII